MVCVFLSLFYVLLSFNRKKGRLDEKMYLCVGYELFLRRVWLMKR